MNQIEQGTLEWLRHRHKGIGASDAPVIMNKSPYKKPFELWEEKIAPEPKFSEPNFIQAKGHSLEPIARAKAEIELGISFKPKLIQSDRYEFLKCSLDGISDDLRDVLEIKYVGKNFNDECPDKYFPQIQYQYALTKCERVHLVQINDDKEIKIFIVPRDLEYIKERLMPTVFDFWEMVVSKSYKIAPELSEALSKYKILKQQIDALEKELESAKKIVFDLTPDKFSYENYTVSTVNKSGSIDYEKLLAEKLPNLKPEDLEPYRKKGSSFKQIRIK